MKKISLLAIVIACLSVNAFAQSGYNPEFLGNASGPAKGGFSTKFFLSYYNQENISSNDAEVAIEPQYWFNGFTGDKGRDYMQVIAHLPVGYRSQKYPGTSRAYVAGIGSLNAGVEYFYKMIDKDGTVFWFDNGLTIGFPTATIHDNVRIGTNAYSIGWFQENYLKIDKWLFSVSPIAVTWTFREKGSNVRAGLSLNVMNSAFGYQVAESVYLGGTFAYLMGNVAGVQDGLGGDLNRSKRLYVGPASLISLGDDLAVQVSGIIDVFTWNANRGQGIFATLWHMF